MNEHDDLRAADPRRQDDPGHLLHVEAPPARPGRRAAALSIAAATVLTAVAGVGAWTAVAQPGAASDTAQGTAGAGAPNGTGQGFSGQGFGGQGSGGQGSGGQDGTGSQGSDGQGWQGDRGGTGQGGATTTGPAATAAQSVGVVTIVSRLGYDSGTSAGTGIVLTSTGRILTNNHVIDGSTRIRVTDESSGRTFTAGVVGTDATRDVAVLQLEGASGLRPAAIDTDGVRSGEAVTAVGNAGGTGALSAASGSITGTDQRITTSSEGATAGETLRGLLETDADVISGDSGGPLQDAEHEVVGITTAATAGSDDPTGYAIPIDDALTIARRIVAGDESGGITIGLPAFLGVSIAPDGDGAVIAQVLDGTAAASTDLAAGDTITAVDGRSVASAEDLTAAIASHEPGDSARIAFTDSSGAAHSISVVLQEGPAD